MVDRTRTIQGNPQGFPQIASPFVDEKGFIQPTWLQFLRSLFIRTGSGEGGAVIPPGGILSFAGGTIPGGYLLCDGSAVSRTDFPNLFTAIGIIWGAGDGQTTFNLPNGQGKTFIGASMSHALGSTGGAETVSLTVDNLAPHTHVVDDPGHVHAALVASSTNTAGVAAGTAVAGNTGSATTGITLEETGSASPITTISPFFAGQWIIKT